jgi:hypothetical protein
MTRVGRCRFTFYSPRRVFPTLPGGEGDCPSWEIIIGVSVIILLVSSLHPCHLIHASNSSPTTILLLSRPYGGGSLRGSYQIPLSLSARLGNLKWAESSTSRHVTSLHFTSPVSIQPSVTHSRILSCSDEAYFAFRDLVYLPPGVNMVSDYSRMIPVGLEVPIAIWIPHVLDVLLMPYSALLPISSHILFTRHFTRLLNQIDPQTPTQKCPTHPPLQALMQPSNPKPRLNRNHSTSPSLIPLLVDSTPTTQRSGHWPRPH